MIDTTTTTEVKLHEVAPQRVTIQCVTCETHARVYRTEPMLKIGAYKYCPVCGSSDIRVYQSSDIDHWEALARDYELPIAVIKQCYALWEPASGIRFGDFVRQLKAEARADKQQSTTA